MREIALESWQTFEVELERLAKYLADQKGDKTDYIARPIFRGRVEVIGGSRLQSSDISGRTSLLRNTTVICYA